METIPVTPGPPIMGVITAGFVFLVIYAFARLSSTGVSRYNACKKAFFLGTILLSIMVLVESLNVWRRILPPIEDASIHMPDLIVPLIVSIPFFLVILIDLSIQWVKLKD